jgi:hypothetical protein
MPFFNIDIDDETGLSGHVDVRADSKEDAVRKVKGAIGGVSRSASPMT